MTWSSRVETFWKQAKNCNAHPHPQYSPIVQKELKMSVRQNKTAVYLLSAAVLLGIVFQVAEAASSSSKQAREATVAAASSHHQSASSASASSDTAARSGWSAPITYAHGLAAVIHPLVLLPLVYFGILWLIVLYGVAAFKHVPQESHGHGQGWRSSSGHGRYRRNVDGDWFTNIQNRVLAAL